MGVDDVRAVVRTWNMSLRWNRASLDRIEIRLIGGRLGDARLALLVHQLLQRCRADLSLRRYWMSAPGAIRVD